MDLNQRMAEIDARIAARTAAVDKRLGIEPTEKRDAAPPADPSAKTASASGRGIANPLVTQAVTNVALPLSAALGKKLSELVRRLGVGESLIAVLAVLFVLNTGWAVNRCLIHPSGALLPDGIEAQPPWWLFATAAGEAVLLLFAILRARRKTKANRP